MDRPTPRADENTRPATPKAKRRWQPDPRNVEAFDRHIRSRYGDEYTWGRWRA